MLDLASDVEGSPNAPSSGTDTGTQHGLVTRLNRVEGQIRGIHRMLQQGRPCIELLQQLAAAEAALNRIRVEVLRHHIDVCITGRGTGQMDDDCRRQLTELIDIFDRFSR